MSQLVLKHPDLKHEDLKFNTVEVHGRCGEGLR